MSDGKQQQPSVGRVVHYVYGDQHYAAIITDPDFTIYNRPADDPWQGPVQALTVFVPMEPLPMVTVAHNDESGAPGTWHWPEYVPAK